jgi:tetratricopeptide (TPR) repeat protein
MYCNQCGVQVDDNATVCPNCGYHLPTEGELPDSAATPVDASLDLENGEPRSRSRGCGLAMIAGMLAGCALLVIVGVGLLAVYQGVQERTRINRAAAIDHYHRGLEQFAVQNYELAKAEFELALQLDSANREASAKLAEVNVLLSRQPTPTSAVRRQTAILLYNEARDLYNKGDWEGVIAKLEQVQVLEPEYELEQVTALLVEAYYKEGLRLAAETRMEEAIRYFDRALKLRPGELAIREEQRLAALYLAGIGYWGANWQGAIDTFTALYQLKPDYKDTRQRLFDAHVKYGDFLYGKNDWCVARDQYAAALTVLADDAARAKQDDANLRCAGGIPPPETPPASGTMVGAFLRDEDVGSSTAMMIRGHVYDGAGKPIAGTRVGLSAWDWNAAPAVTNGEGAFAFDGLGNPVTYTVTLLDLPTVPLPVKADWSKLVWVEFRPAP